jgi:modulator of FtsH protease HflK
MRGTGDKPQIDILAMARGKSPWGGGKPGDDAGTEAADPPATDDGEVKDAEAPAEEPARNPWLPPVEDGDGRRSARIDDILRPRRGTSDPGTGTGWPQLPGGDKARVILPWVLAGSAVLLALSTSLHVLDQGQSGTVTTFGRYSRSLGPGMHLTMPWPVEAVAIRGNKGAEELSLPDKGNEMLLLTREGELIDISFKLRWQVSDPRRFAGAFADPEASLRSLALAEMRAGIAEVRFDDVYEGKRQADLQQRVAGRVQRALDAMRAGIKVDSIEVTRAKPPGQLTEAFKKVGAAKAEIEKVRLQAEKWAAETRKSAQSDAAGFDKVYEQYKLAPEVIRKRMYYETMERVLLNHQHIVVGGDAAPAPDAPKPAKPQTGGQ